MPISEQDVQALPVEWVHRTFGDGSIIPGAYGGYKTVDEQYFGALQLGHSSRAVGIVEVVIII